MQTKDIKTGADYGYTSTLSRYGWNGAGAKYLARARVVSAPVNGQVEVKIYYDGSKRADTTRMVPIKNLTCTWADHEQAVAVKDAARTESIAEMKKNVKTITRLSGVKVKDLPHGLDGEVCNDGSYSSEGKISVRDLAVMLQAAYDLGKKEA